MNTEMTMYVTTALDRVRIANNTDPVLAAIKGHGIDLNIDRSHEVTSAAWVRPGVVIVSSSAARVLVERGGMPGRANVIVTRSEVSELTDDDHDSVFRDAMALDAAALADLPTAAVWLRDMLTDQPTDEAPSDDLAGYLARTFYANDTLDVLDHGVLGQLAADAVRAYPGQSDAAELLAAYDTWSENRGALSAQEESGADVDPDAWEASDATAVDLADRLADALRAATATAPQEG